MPNTPLNKEELRYKVQEIIQSFHNPLDNGSGHHSIVYTAKEVVALIEADRDAAVREAEKAYGGCHKCYGKGYATYEGKYFSRVGVWDDTAKMKFCDCERGKQLKLSLQSQPNAKEGE